jgi:predicted DNA-binding transcriptional regulator AlpA
MASRYIYLPETAEMLNISEATRRFWVRRGYGPASAKWGRRLVFDRELVEVWAQNQFAERAADQSARQAG